MLFAVDNDIRKTLVNVASHIIVDVKVGFTDLLVSQSVS